MVVDVPQCVYVRYSATLHCVCQVQRYLSLPDLATAQRAVRWNFLLAAVLWLLVGWLGLVMYAVYAECDPITAHQERKTNLQLVGKEQEIQFLLLTYSK